MVNKVPHNQSCGVLRMFLRCAAYRLAVIALVKPSTLVRVLAVSPLSVSVFLAILTTDSVTGHLVLKAGVELRKGLSDVVFRGLVGREVDERSEVVDKCLASEVDMDVGTKNDLFFHNSILFWLIKETGHNWLWPALFGNSCLFQSVAYCDAATRADEFW